MAYEVKLTIKGEEIPFKRTETPFFKDTTRALILQQHQVKIWDKKDGPTDEDLINNEKDVANFASSFFNANLQQRILLMERIQNQLLQFQKLLMNA